MGSLSELQQLIDAHYQPLYRFAFRLAGTSADAEDLTQETFGKALSRLPQLRDPQRARGWLFRILRNAYLHRVRDQKRHRIVPLESVGDIPERPSEDWPEIDPAQLQHALNELEDRAEHVLIMNRGELVAQGTLAELRSISHPALMTFRLPG